MKKILLLFIISAFTIVSCKSKGDTKANTIVGKWKPVEMNISSMKEEEKKEAMESTALEFTSDNKFFVYHNKDKREGTYKLEGKDLTTTTMGDNEKFTVDFDGGKLVMTNKEGVVKLKKD